MKIIIIGGDAAGMSAASKIMRTMAGAKITVYEQGTVLSYAACGLPYYIGGLIQDESSLVIRSKSDFEKRGIAIHTRHRVTKIDDTGKTVIAENLDTGMFIEDKFDKLIIASGAAPIVPKIPGVELNNIMVLGGFDDGVNIRKRITDSNIKKVAIIGAGFIGIEMAEAMLKLDKEVTLIEFKDQVLPLFDQEMMVPIQEELVGKGVELKLNEKVIEFSGLNEVQRVVTDKNSYRADLVIICIGVKPSTDFLKGTRIEQLQNGAVKVDKKMQSSVPDIYAAGDCATVYHRVLNIMDAYIPLATNANKQGRILGSVICGKDTQYDSALGTFMVKACDFEAAKTGLSEKEAIQAGLDYQTVSVNGNNHAGYYPEKANITVKLLYHAKTKEILGAQIVGKKEAALRINSVAIAISGGMKTYELAMADFGYAPPFSGVWDIVAIAAAQAQ